MEILCNGIKEDFFRQILLKRPQSYIITEHLWVLKNDASIIKSTVIYYQSNSYLVKNKVAPEQLIWEVE